MDALAGQRSAGDDAASRRLLTELLIQMTLASEQDQLFVFACTNRIKVSVYLKAGTMSVPNLHSLRISSPTSGL